MYIQVVPHYISSADKRDKEVAIEVTRWEKKEIPIPSQDDIDDVAEWVDVWLNMYGLRTGGWIVYKQLQSYPGVAVYILAEDYVIVYWFGDPRIRALILAKTVEDLPKLLVSSSLKIRTAAQMKLERLSC